MALANLKLDSVDSDVVKFVADIGSNRFYQFKIGSEKNRIEGYTIIDNISFESPLIEHNDTNAFNSEFEISVPKEKFDSKQKFIQLQSFKDARKSGMSFSEILLLNEPLNPQPESLPHLLSTSSSTPMNSIHHKRFNECRSVSFSFVESKSFDPNLMNGILELAKMVAPIVVGVVSGAANRQGGAAPNTSPQSDSNLLGVVNSILGSLMTGTTPAPASPGASHTLSIRKQNNKYSRTSKTPNIQRNSYAKPMFIDGGIITGPILAALVGSILDKGPAILNAINQGNLQQEQAVNTHAENLFAESNRTEIAEAILRNAHMVAMQPPPTPQVFESDALRPTTPPTPPAQSRTASIPAKKNGQLKISFSVEKKIGVRGIDRCVYDNTKAIQLNLKLQDDLKYPVGILPRVLIDVVFQSPITKEQYLSKTIQATNVNPTAELAISIDQYDISKLLLSKDIIVSAKLRYQTNNRKIATSNIALTNIYLIHDYFLGSVGEIKGEATTLTDMNKFRPFQNNIWQSGNQADKHWDALLDLKYYTKLNQNSESNARIESKIKIESIERESEHRQKMKAKLKSGIELSPVELNKLTSMISSYSELNSAQLAVLQTESMNTVYNLQASTNVKMRGRKDETGMIWAFPEFAIQNIQLKKVAVSNINGLVMETTDETVQFPVPTAIKFVGVKSESMSLQSSEIDSNEEDTESEGFKMAGYSTLFEVRVALLPAQLIPTSSQPLN